MNEMNEIINECTKFNSTKLGIQLSIKSCSDRQPLISVLELQEGNEHPIPVGELKEIQNPYGTLLSELSSDRQISTDTILSGETLDKLIDEDIKRNSNVLPWENNKSTGSSTITLEQIDKVYPDESWKSSRDNLFYNMFMVDLRIQISKVEDRIFVIKAESEYKDNEGNWVPCAYTAIGSKSDFYDYEWERSPYNIPFNKNSSSIITLRTDIPIKGHEIVNKKRRVHQSLPYPLEVKFTLTDNTGERCSIIVLCYDNDKINLPTREKEEEEVKFDWWLQCDDVSAIHRVWLGCYIDSSVRLKTNESSYSISRDEFFKLSWEASKQKLKEISFDKELSLPPEISIKLVLDEIHYIPIALHILLKTSTSSVESWKEIPLKLLHK